MENYGDKAVYWYRREAVEKFFQDVKSALPRFEERRLELDELNRQLRVIHNTTFFKCVYLFREGQTLTTEYHGNGGGYSDRWLRCDHYILPRSNANDEDDSDLVPMPGKPVEIEFQEPYRGRGYSSEFTQCWHPICMSDYLERPTERHRHPTIYLLCKTHVDPRTVKILHDYCMFGTPIRDPEILKMVETVRSIITTRIDQSLTEALDGAKQALLECSEPEKVIEVECRSLLNDEDSEEDITYYIDLVSCEKIIRNPEDDDTDDEEN